MLVVCVEENSGRNAGVLFLLTYNKNVNSATDKGKCGLEDDPAFPNWREKICRHPEHKPPGMIFIPYGKRYRHICPRCGKISFITSSQAWWKGSNQRSYCQAEVVV